MIDETPLIVIYIGILPNEITNATKLVSLQIGVNSMNGNFM